jgi:hypothetical protein
MKCTVLALAALATAALAAPRAGTAQRIGAAEAGGGGAVRRVTPEPPVLAATGAGLLDASGPYPAQDRGVRKEHPARAAVEASFRLSRLRGRTARMAGVAALLSVGDRFAFGGGGWVMLSDMTVERPGGGLDFTFAYGGALGELRLWNDGAKSCAARLMVGAGNAKLSLPRIGTDIEADNFGVVDPEVSASLHVIGPLDLSAAAGYRMVFGVQDLPGVEGEDLRGWTARLSLRLGTP